MSLYAFLFLSGIISDVFSFPTNFSYTLSLGLSILILLSPLICPAMEVCPCLNCLSYCLSFYCHFCFVHFVPVVAAVDLVVVYFLVVVAAEAVVVVAVHSVCHCPYSF